MALTLVADLGSTRIKIGLVSLQGELVDLIALPAPRLAVSGAVAELDMEELWRTFVCGAAELMVRAAGRGAGVSAIAVTGPTRTQVLLDEHAVPLLPALAWSDTRAAGMIEEVRSRLPTDHPEITQINAFHPLARLAWVAQERPDVMARVHAVIEPKDFIVARLTGIVVSDPVSMARLTAAAAPGPSGAGLLECLGLPSHLVPRLLPPQAVAGRARADLDGLKWLAGLPVMVGSNDTWTAVLGLGALRPGYAYAISGTTEVFGGLAAKPHTADGLLTVEWGPDLFQIGGPGQNGADTLDWLMRLLPGDATTPPLQQVAALLARPRHRQPALFLPYLRGERVPFWDPALRGAFLGLARDHGAGDLVWAALEGLALLNRIVLTRAEAAIGAPVNEVRIGGGLSRLAQAGQLKADVLGRDVVTGVAEEPGLIGAGLLAAVGVHGAASLAEAQQLVPVGRRYVPDPARLSFYDALFDVFTDAHGAVAPLSHRLAGLDVGR